MKLTTIIELYFQFLVADTRLYTLPCRSVGRSVRPSVTFLSSEQFPHYCSCQTVRDWIAVYPALFHFFFNFRCYSIWVQHYSLSIADMQVYTLPCWSVGPSVQNISKIASGFHMTAPAQSSVTRLPYIWPCFLSIFHVFWWEFCILFIFPWISRVYSIKILHFSHFLVNFLCYSIRIPFFSFLLNFPCYSTDTTSWWINESTFCKTLLQHPWSSVLPDWRRWIRLQFGFW